MKKLYRDNPFRYNIIVSKGLVRKANNKLLLSATSTAIGGTFVQYYYNNYESLPAKIIIGASAAIMGSQLVINIYDYIKIFKSNLDLVELGDVLKNEGINIELLKFVYDENTLLYCDFKETEELDFIVENEQVCFKNDLKNKKVFYVDKENNKEREITDLIDKAWMLKK